VGAARRRLHPILRGSGRLADYRHKQDLGLAADADRVAVGRLDLPAPPQKPRPSTILSRRLAPGVRCDLGSQGPEIPHGRSRPRHRGSWCGRHPGRDRKTVEKFPDLLDKERCEQMIALAMLSLSGLCPPLPGRCTTHGTCRRFVFPSWWWPLCAPLDSPWPCSLVPSVARPAWSRPPLDPDKMGRLPRESVVHRGLRLRQREALEAQRMATFINRAMRWTTSIAPAICAA
jgi:hypothetical protein